MARTQYQRFKSVRNERNWLREKLTEITIEIQLLSENVKRGAQGSNWISDELDMIERAYRSYTNLDEAE